jgi:8-oxo-dGTP pyrophosphatase MutT (NUDIX family)
MRGAPDTLPPNPSQPGLDYVGITTCFYCYNSDGQLFMAQRSQNARDENGCWDTGGGKLEFGIPAMDNVRKEVLEEYGIAPGPVDFLGYRDVLRVIGGADTHWLALDFAVYTNGDQPMIKEPEKFDASGWFTFSALPDPLHSQVATAIDRYADTIRDLAISRYADPTA